MASDLDRILAALRAPADRDWVPARPGDPPDRPDEPGRLGRPPALTPAQVRSIRRRRARPLAERPRLAELAAEFRVDVVTIRKALRGRPPYDFGDPAPIVGGPHRDRGSGRFW